ncbi:coiled-coil-helix-coiled-coil-helix domain-containing protein 7 isoform 2-T2 [Molossus nigricans]|uniref:coiled-coil-helix-coiled-coil-helix domain-containing protein 7 isoform X2 n=1 Tax=Molossus molossus TaxID=27622 RepID=UPI001745CA20|nr:coiled-coil-helix-coiled-coil-helix domain-containing protein 7 isoform X2 [Molossus molossus]
MLGCALFKVLLRELLTCLELETVRSLVERLPELFSPTSAILSKKTVRMPMVARRLRDPDINPCLLIPFHLLNDAYLTYLRNLMLLPDVWMKITMTGKGVLITS